MSSRPPRQFQGRQRADNFSSNLQIDPSPRLQPSPHKHRLSHIKTTTVREAKPQLGELVEKVQHGAPVILVQGDKLAKLERYELLDPECDSPQLEAMLLEAVRGPHAAYSRKKLDAVLAKVAGGSRGK